MSFGTMDMLNEPSLKDSGNRTEFESGAVRDIQNGKGRCDLMDLDALAKLVAEKDCERDNVLAEISLFKEYGKEIYVLYAIEFLMSHFSDKYTAMLELSIHFEQGAEKYGPNNWKKGIPVNSYIDSAVRHYLKFKRGDTDERHDRAAMWNLMCCYWTCKNKSELNCYKKE